MNNPNIKKIEHSTRVAITNIEKVRKLLCDYAYGKMFNCNHISKEVLVDSRVTRLILNYLIRLGYVKFVRGEKNILYYFGKEYIGKEYEKKFREVKYGETNSEMVEKSFERSELISDEIMEEQNGETE